MLRSIARAILIETRPTTRKVAICKSAEPEIDLADIGGLARQGFITVKKAVDDAEVIRLDDHRVEPEHAPGSIEANRQLLRTLTLFPSASREANQKGEKVKLAKKRVKVRKHVAAQTLPKSSGLDAELRALKEQLDAMRRTLDALTGNVTKSDDNAIAEVLERVVDAVSADRPLGQVEYQRRWDDELDQLDREIASRTSGLYALRYDDDSPRHVDSTRLTKREREAVAARKAEYSRHNAKMARSAFGLPDLDQPENEAEVAKRERDLDPKRRFAGEQLD